MSVVDGETHLQSFQNVPGISPEKRKQRGAGDLGSWGTTVPLTAALLGITKEGKTFGM